MTKEKAGDVLWTLMSVFTPAIWQGLCLLWTNVLGYKVMMIICSPYPKIYLELLCQSFSPCYTIHQNHVSYLDVVVDCDVM